MASETPSEAVTAGHDLDVEDGQKSVSHGSGENSEPGEKAIDSSVKPDVNGIAGSDQSLPLDWPLGKKIFNMAIPSILCFVV